MRYHGVVGYAITEEYPADSGIWVEHIVEKPVTGDVLTCSSRWQNGNNQINDDINLENKISILADPFACQNFHRLRYITHMGTKWKVSIVNVQRPRLILTLGGEYNGEQAESAGDTEDSDRE